MILQKHIGPLIAIGEAQWMDLSLLGREGRFVAISCPSCGSVWAHITPVSSLLCGTCQTETEVTLDGFE